MKNKLVTSDHTETYQRLIFILQLRGNLKRTTFPLAVTYWTLRKWYTQEKAVKKNEALFKLLK